jgi:hypothetical protein
MFRGITLAMIISVPVWLALQLHKKTIKRVVKSLRRPVDMGYKQIVYQTINLIQEATASEIQ